MLIIDIGSILVLPLVVLLWTRNTYITFIALLFVLVFMYSPERTTTYSYDTNIFYSPSAGYVQDISQDDTHVTLTLLLNIFDNHTQYFPMESILLESKKFNGGFDSAFTTHSINNEKIEHTLQSVKHGFKYTITQITGLLTRRILILAEQGRVYPPGNRLGFIVLGSRVDIRIPKVNIQQILIKPKSHIQEMTRLIELKSNQVLILNDIFGRNRNTVV